MTREHKLALIIGFALILAFGLLISDHLSRATFDKLDGEQVEPPASIAIRPIEKPQPPATRQPEPRQQEQWTAPVPTQARNEQTPPSPEPELTVIDQTPQPTAQQRLAELTEEVANRQFQPLVAGTRNANEPADRVIWPRNRVEQPAVREPESARTHQVAKGDTLYGIAQHYYGDGRLWRELIKHNKDRVASNGALSERVTLRIPPLELLRDQPRPAPDPRAEQAPQRRERETTQKPETYTVVKGDTLGEISQRTLGTSKRVGEIVALNDLSDPDAIRIGMTLKLPPK